MKKPAYLMSLPALALILFFFFCNTAAAQYCGPPNCDQTLYQQCIASGGSFSGSNCSCFPYSPVVIAINGSPYRFTEADLQFDINGDGTREELSWTDPTTDVGFLVLDRNGNGTIDNGLELFGNVTSQPPSSTPNGFAALAVFDDPRNGGNGDGVINAADAPLGGPKPRRHQSTERTTHPFSGGDQGHFTRLRAVQT